MDNTTKEWNDKFNPFNSDKILIWREWLEGCATGNFLPPITIDIDPSNKCNLNCIWCNFSDYIEDTRSMIPEHHLIQIADFCKRWGVRSAHILGGGEPFTNPGTTSLLYRLKQNNVESGVITNGILLNESCIEAVGTCCRWIGISIDAGTNNTYQRVKGTPDNKLFDVVISNFSSMCKFIKDRKTNCSVCYKFLLHPYNAGEIYEAAVLAKSIGANQFQVRPAGWENIGNKNVERFDFLNIMDEVNSQMEKALQLESKDFHVYGVRHKFTPTIKRKTSYTSCKASPIVLIFGADGNCYVCGDRRGQKEFILCSHYPDVEQVLAFWNSKKHKDIIDSVKLNECPRCVLGPYHEIIEKVFIKNTMCRNFP